MLNVMETIDCSHVQHQSTLVSWQGSFKLSYQKHGTCRLPGALHGGCCSCSHCYSKIYLSL